MDLPENAVEAELPGKFDPDWQVLRSAATENVFMHASVGLLKEAGTLCALVAGVISDSPHQRDGAIRCGLLVRLGKLCRLMLADTCDIGGGQQLGLSRQIIDAATALIYLSEDKDGSRHQAFVENSLVGEREMLKDIDHRQVAGGEAWPIEERMQCSIARSAAAAGVTDVSALPGRASIGWPSAKELIRLLGPTAYTAYRAGSSEIHGGWHDLYRNHLREVEGGFAPEFGAATPRPQPLLAASLVALLGARAYLTRRPPQEIAFFNERLVSLEERLQRVDALHERYLQRLDGVDQSTTSQ